MTRPPLALFDADARGRAAILSPCGTWRYELRRTWRPGRRFVVFVMLNPSTADADADDPTIRRCVDFGQRWNYDGLIVVNLFAFRATQPSAMRAARDPIGPENDLHIARALDAILCDRSDVVCAWGTNGDFMDRDRTVLAAIREAGIVPVALGVTQHGHPRHPLYAKANSSLAPYAGRR